MPETCRQVRRRSGLARYVKYLTLLLLAIAYYALRDDNWIHWVPTSWLLEALEDREGWCWDELRWRYIRGKITEEDFGKGNSSVQLWVDDRSRFPTGLPVPILVRRGSLLDPDSSLPECEAEVTATTAGRVIWESSYSGMSSRIYLPALPAGCYVVTMTGVQQFGGQSLPFEATAEVVVENASEALAVRVAWSQRLANWVSRNMPLTVREDEIQGGFHWIEFPVDLVPFEFGGTLWARPSGSEHFHLVDRDVLLRPWESWDYSAFTEAREFRGATGLDVRLVPDVLVADESGLTECFAGVIEWHDVPVGGESRLPTRVAQYAVAGGGANGH